MTTARDYLLDTNVISQEVKLRPDKGVMTWLDSASNRRLFISVVVLGEARRWMERRPEGKRKLQLREWVKKWEGLPPGRILPVTLEVAQQWAALSARNPNFPEADGLIAATAMVRGMIVATGDSDYKGVPGLTVFNPFMKQAPRK